MRPPYSFYMDTLSQIKVFVCRTFRFAFPTFLYRLLMLLSFPILIPTPFSYLPNSHTCPIALISIPLISIPLIYSFNSSFIPLSALQRTEYEDEMNRLSVALIFASDFVFANGALTPLAPLPSTLTESTGVNSPAGSDTIRSEDSTPVIESVRAITEPTSPNDQSSSSILADGAFASTSLILDRRKTVSDMVAAIRDVGGVKVGEKGRDR